MPHPSLPFRLIAACTLLLGSTLAHAQYSWIGANGVRQFSDRPPPPGTPPHKILKAPGRAAPAPAPVPVPEPAPQAAPVAKPAPSLAQREADYRKRVAAREEQEQKEAAEARRQRDLAEHCDAAREMRAQLDSGIRVAKFDAKGERSFVSDEERAAQLARVDRALAACR
ncbi:DUF4124 domain-containing protein [Massilia sp. X63]|uniref:DUF4124 domain-containing protein n=1 Tax=Massilia sp. X63 TaxID=3237285 RepID=UPI0034DD9DE2